MTHLRRINLFLFILFSGLIAKAQDDLMALADEMEEDTTYATEATFKASRLVSGQSIETIGGGVLQFIIGHRFGNLNSGAYNFFGLDQASIRIGFDLGITDDLMIGIGRSSFEKTYDGYLKYRLLKQREGARSFPLSLTLFGNTALNTLRGPVNNSGEDLLFRSRLAYTAQALIARKFSSALSLQLMPTFVHYNLVPEPTDQNSIFAIGGGGRIKLTPGVALVVEYYYLPDGQLTSDYIGRERRNALSVGFDIETGGHVFQLHFTNSTSMITKGFIGQTTGDWFNGDIRFGFNVNRVFTIWR